MTRDLDALPKAHLHLHFTGSMSIASLQYLADVGDIARFVLAYRRVASMLHAPPQGVTR